MCKRISGLDNPPILHTPYSLLLTPYFLLLLTRPQLKDLFELADASPNVNMKVGGIQMAINGFKLSSEARDRLLQEAVLGIAEQQPDRRAGGLLLAVRVIEQDVVDVLHGVERPLAGSLGSEVQHRAGV